MLPFEREIVRATSVELTFNKNIDLAMGGGGSKQLIFVNTTMKF